MTKVLYAILPIVSFTLEACDRPLPPEPEPSTAAIVIMGQTVQTNGTPISGVTVLFESGGCKRQAIADSVVSDAHGTFAIRLEQLKNAQDLEGPCEVRVLDRPPANSGFIPALGYMYLEHVHFRYPVTDTFRIIKRLPRQQFHSIGRKIYDDCVGWVEKPETERVIVDVLFEWARQDDAMQRRYVEAHGGEILQELNVPGYRVEIETDSIPVMDEGVSPDSLLNVWTVPDISRTDLRVWVTFDRQVTYADVRQLEAMGARVLYWYRNEDGFIIDIANDALPMVIAMNGFKDMIPNLTYCAL